MAKPVHTWSKCDFTLHLFKPVRGEWPFGDPHRLYVPYKFYDAGWRRPVWPKRGDPGPMRFEALTKPLFSGKDYSPGIGDTTQMVVAGILRFLALRPGDVDDRFFAKYNKNQETWLELGMRSYLLSNLADELEADKVFEYRKEANTAEWEPWLWRQCIT